METPAVPLPATAPAAPADGVMGTPASRSSSSAQLSLRPHALTAPDSVAAHVPPSRYAAATRNAARKLPLPIELADAAAAARTLSAGRAMQVTRACARAGAPVDGAGAGGPIGAVHVPGSGLRHWEAGGLLRHLLRRDAARCRAEAVGHLDRRAQRESRGRGRGISRGRAQATARTANRQHRQQPSGGSKAWDR